MLNKLRTRLRALLRKSEMERELDEELRHHIERQTEQNIRLGMNPEEARYAARKAFGGVEQAKERSRDARGVRWLEALWQDLRYGARMLVKNPGFTLITTFTLALGIGANTAIFSVVYGVLLKPLPYKDAGRIVIANISQPDFRDVKASSQSFDQMAMWAPDMHNVMVDGETKQVPGAFVSPEFLPMLSQPALGRLWRADEDTRHLAVLSHDYWQSDFRGEAGVIGKTIWLSGKPHTVVGVMPPEFQFPSREFQIWNTLGAANIEALQQMENRQLRIFGAVAHLKPGVSLVQAQAEMDTIFPTVAATISRYEFRHPDSLHFAV